MLMKVEAGFEHYSKNPYIYTRSMNPKSKMPRIEFVLPYCFAACHLAE